MQYHQHVIDWYRSMGFRVIVLTDWSLMCISEYVIATTDPERLREAVNRRLAHRGH